MGLDFTGLPARVVTDRQIELAGSIAAIGAFDGVHRGHQHLIRAMVAEAQSAGLPSLVWTFDPPPKVFFGRATLLSPLAERLARIARLGPDYIVVASFTALYAAHSAERFVSDLARITPRRVHVGADFRFGARQMGDIALLARHFDIAVARPVLCEGGETISSTRIRALKALGRRGEADDLLGPPSVLALLGGGQRTMDIRQREENDGWI
jgi:riboflavin kinase / FMN adenylyltransferase